MALAVDWFTTVTVELGEVPMTLPISVPVAAPVTNVLADSVKGTSAGRVSDTLNPAEVLGELEAPDRVSIRSKV
jgi:hypothetical protein